MARTQIHPIKYVHEGTIMDGFLLSINLSGQVVILDSSLQMFTTIHADRITHCRKAGNWEAIKS